MIVGHVRDFLPRVVLSLPGRDGRPLAVEFIVDTAFDGDLSLPSQLMSQLDITYLRDRILRLANGAQEARPFYEVSLDWHDETRPTEITVLENDSLLGAVLLHGSHIDLEMTDGGEVTIDAL